MSHSILPPSSAHIWGAPHGCTGWVSMMAAVPDEYKNLKTPESLEGDAAHELSAQMIQAGTRGGIGKPTRASLVGTQVQGVVVTDEMYEACELYADDVTAIMRKTRIMGGPYLGIEKSVDIPSVHELNHGTPDVFIHAHQLRSLYLWDFEYGHRYVDEFENWQTIDYIAGIIDTLNIDGYDDQKLKVFIRIVQPRAYGSGGPIREWAVMASDLRAYINILRKNATIALSSEAVNRTGPHCRDCKARHMCPDALKAGISMYEYSSKPVPQDMSLAAMGLQYAMIERAKEQISSLESGFQERIKFLLKSGKNVPPYGLEPTEGRQRWTIPDVEVIAMGDMMGKDLRTGKPITPNQASKKHMDASVIASFSERPNGVKLTKNSVALATRIFQQKEI